MSWLFILFLSLSANASELVCFQCLDGFQLCYADPTRSETQIRRKCEGYKTSSCRRGGWGRQRHLYDVRNENNEQTSLGFNQNFYTSSEHCNQERNEDLRTEREN